VCVYVRHPAYVCKNLAWWLAASPALVAGFGVSLAHGLWQVAFMAGWSWLYLLRALREEAHMMREDVGYADYCLRVPRRFLPRFGRS
jgi:protein-S-isoprenylcysteine O-methyltransferase Ste14